jgi:hypothetical protein
VSAADDTWVRSILTDPEYTVWRRQARADRLESLRVARRTQRILGDGPHQPDGAVLAAGLLHDVGKTEARLGTFGRVAATLAGAVRGRDRARGWQARGGIARRFGNYLRHAEIGGDMLAIAGARPEAIEWARAHHHPERFDALPFPAEVAWALAAADGEPLPRSARE